MLCIRGVVERELLWAVSYMNVVIPTDFLLVTEKEKNVNFSSYFLQFSSQSLQTIVKIKEREVSIL